jgi:hypothetical protein
MYKISVKREQFHIIARSHKKKLKKLSNITGVCRKIISPRITGKGVSKWTAFIWLKTGPVKDLLKTAMNSTIHSFLPSVVCLMTGA